MAEEFDPVPDELEPVLQTSKIEAIIKRVSLTDASFAEIGREISMNRNSVYRHAQEGVEHGLIEKQELGHYTPTEKLIDLLDSFDSLERSDVENSDFQAEELNHDWRGLIERVREEKGEIDLSELEQSIVMTIQNHGGRVPKQSLIVEETDIGPGKTSYWIDKLEEKEVVERQVNGKSNEVKLIQEINLNPDTDISQLTNLETVREWLYQDLSDEDSSEDRTYHSYIMKAFLGPELYEAVYNSQEIRSQRLQKTNEEPR